MTNPSDALELGGSVVGPGWGGVDALQDPLSDPEEFMRRLIESSEDCITVLGASDIPVLAAFFTASLSRTLGKPIKGFNARGVERPMRYAWPGNVRELQNVVERAAILSSGPVLELEEKLLGGEASEGHAPAAPPFASTSSPVAIMKGSKRLNGLTSCQC